MTDLSCSSSCKGSHDVPNQGGKHSQWWDRYQNDIGNVSILGALKWCRSAYTRQKRSKSCVLKWKGSRRWILTRFSEIQQNYVCCHSLLSCLYWRWCIQKKKKKKGKLGGVRSGGTTEEDVSQSAAIVKTKMKEKLRKTERKAANEPMTAHFERIRLQLEEFSPDFCTSSPFPPHLCFIDMPTFFFFFTIFWGLFFP